MKQRRAADTSFELVCRARSLASHEGAFSETDPVTNLRISAMKRNRTFERYHEVLGTPLLVIG